MRACEPFLGLTFWVARKCHIRKQRPEALHGAASPAPGQSLFVLTWISFLEDAAADPARQLAGLGKGRSLD